MQVGDSALVEHEMASGTIAEIIESALRQKEWNVGEADVIPTMRTTALAGSHLRPRPDRGGPP